MDEKRAVLWAAVSSARQAAEERASLPDQLAAGREAAEREGFEVVAELVVEGQSREIVDPAEAVAEIAAYRELKALADGGEFDVLIHVRADRLGRTRTLIAWVQEMLAERGIACWNLEAGQPPDRADPLVDSLRAGVTVREELELRRRWRSGMVRRVGELGRHSGRLPRGYRRRREDDREWVEVDPEAAPGVARMFERFMEGASLRSLAREAGMSPSGLRKLLANPFYVGRVRLRLKRNAAGPAEARLSSLPSEKEAEAALEALASDAPELAASLRTEDPDEAVRVKRRLMEAGVEVTVYEDGPVGMLMRAFPR